jgi:hypothetical protein
MLAVAFEALTPFRRVPIRAATNGVHYDPPGRDRSRIVSLSRSRS